MKILKKDKQGSYQNYFHPFRINFKSQLATRANNFVIEYMMGHEIGVEKDYFLADHDGKEGLRNYYAENMEPHLSINIRNGTPTNNDDTVEELRK